jgi:hypothetical protein
MGDVLGSFRVSELAEYWIVSCKQCPQKWSVNRKTTGSAATAPERFKTDAGERAVVQMVEHADTHAPRVLHEVAPEVTKQVCHAMTRDGRTLCWKLSDVRAIAHGLLPHFWPLGHGKVSDPEAFGECVTCPDCRQAAGLPERPTGR